MDFAFRVESVLPEEICKVNNMLQINGRRSILGDKDKKSQILKIINELGAASAMAQDLQTQVTTGEKLLSSDHSVYIMRETTTTTTANDSTKSVVVGILKMGRKKLFLLDYAGTQNELLPLCVLDFYIHESRQRMGYGKKLFAHMLNEENVKPQMLAIDRPSSKFLAFLQKHYHLRKTIPQVNNFIIFDGFFKDRQTTRRKSEESCQSYTCGVLTDTKQLPLLMDSKVRNPNRTSFPFTNGSNQSFSWQDRNTNQENNQGLSGMSAQANLYSRYQSSPKDEGSPTTVYSASKPDQQIPSRQSQSMLGLLQWQSETPKTKQNELDFPAAPVTKETTLGETKEASLAPVMDTRTPVTSPNLIGCAAYSHNAIHPEDSTMKIFGVPSAWMHHETSS